MFKSMVQNNDGPSILRGDHINGENQPTVEFVDDLNPGMLNSITGLPSRA